MLARAVGWGGVGWGGVLEELGHGVVGWENLGVAKAAIQNRKSSSSRAEWSDKLQHPLTFLIVSCLK